MTTPFCPLKPRTFHKFQSLPRELRAKIWEELIYVGPRTIPVFFSLHRKIRVRFNRGCSHPDHLHGLFSSHDGSQLLGAYFHTNYPAISGCVFPPESVATNSSLSQVNHEARSHVRRHYPEIIRVYNGRGELALNCTLAKSRLLHFNPATDLVVLYGRIFDLEDHDPLWLPDRQVVLSPERKFPHPAESIATVRLLQRVAIPSGLCDPSCDHYFFNEAGGNEPLHSAVGMHFCHRHEAMALGYMDSLREVWIYPFGDDWQCRPLAVPHQLSEDEIRRAIIACGPVSPDMDLPPPFVVGKRMMDVLQVRLTESDIPYLKANYWTPQSRADPLVGMLAFGPPPNEDNPIPAGWEDEDTEDEEVEDDPCGDHSNDSSDLESLADEHVENESFVGDGEDYSSDEKHDDDAEY